MVADRSSSETARRIGTGLAFVVFPLLFVFAFAVHPDLLHPHLLGPRALILRAHGAELLQLGHVLVTLSTALLVVVAVHFAKVLERRRAGWAGLVGGALAIVGAVLLAADKGALCLSMSAMDTLPEPRFADAMPALLAMFSKAGWMVILWGIVLLPLGFAVQAIALIRTNALPRWMGLAFLLGVLFIGTPDGVEIVNLGASVLMAAALVPYGVGLIADRRPADDRTG